MLRTVLSLFFLVSSTVAELAEFTARCGFKNSTTFTKTEDNVEGRYMVEWCSELKNATVWKLELQYTLNNSACQENLPYIKRRSFQTIMHSPVEQNITKRPQCYITCLSLPLDMVFSGCYVIRNDVADEHTHQPVYTFHRIDNKFHSFEAINELQPVNVVQQDGHELKVTYNLHYIHVQVFGMRALEYKQNSTTKEVDESEWVDIRHNCTLKDVQVDCRVHAPPAGRCLKFSLEFHAWWRNSFKNRKDLIYCSLPSKEVEMDPGMDARVWWAVGALVLTLTLLAACWAAHTKLLANLRKKVLHDWVHRYAAYTAEHAPAPVADPGHILLLYARDCEPAMEAINILKKMLEEGAPGRVEYRSTCFEPIPPMLGALPSQLVLTMKDHELVRNMSSDIIPYKYVYDIFSESCMALYAEAPEEWLCGVLSRPDVRVVLVQTPAAAALYAAQVSQDNLQMQQPLLGARVHYKKPLYADVLLQYALRLVRDMAPMQQEYARYYIATVSEQEYELMPQVSPYRRYSLPVHATQLLSDLRLRLPVDQPQRLRSLATALEHLLKYVGDNENYLRDELMFI